MGSKAPKVAGKSQRYEQLLRGEISSKQYVMALKSEALSHRGSRSLHGTARGASA